jgi:hypothetical protein
VRFILIIAFICMCLGWSGIIYLSSTSIPDLYLDFNNKEVKFQAFFRPSIFFCPSSSNYRTIESFFCPDLYI